MGGSGNPNEGWLAPPYATNPRRQALGADVWGEFMKVLVVEDEPLIRLGIASLVEEGGFVVTEAINADHAIRILEADPDIRVVITDVDMPGGMDGIRLAHYVRDRWPPIKLIVISGKVGVSPTELPSGSRFFAKPAREDALLSALRELAAGGAA
jgi:two-component system, response regulator PdtaR